MPLYPDGQGVGIPACFGATHLSRRRSGKAGARLPAYQGENALETTGASGGHDDIPILTVTGASMSSCLQEPDS